MSAEKEAEAGKIPELYPWHQENWLRLRQSIAADRMPHGLLLTRPEGLGKAQFCVQSAAAMLCTSPADDGMACGQCKNCHLFRAGTHPDYRRIEPEEPGKAIRIDTIREFTAKEALTSQGGGYKVIIIEPADAMNSSAANSLLKTLEEPVARTLMVLITSKPVRLPATIRSRCQKIPFTVPDHKTATDWLAPQIGQQDATLLLSLASGSPLQALALTQGDALKVRSAVLDEFCKVLARKTDPVSVAARWNTLQLPQLLGWMSGWLIDLIRLKMVPATENLINRDQKERLQALALAIELKALYALLDKLLDATRTLGSQLNSHILLEDLVLTSVTIKQRNARVDSRIV